MAALQTMAPWLTTCNLTMAELEQRGAALDTPERAAEYEREALSVRPDDLATLIYTSGTTGAPKGVMLTHDNFHSNVMAARQSVPFSNTDVALSFLPLSHVFEREGDYMFWSCGTTLAYVPSIDDVPTALQEVRPTMAMSVPRLYEKMYARVLENAKAGGAVKWRIFNWARSVANRWADERLAGRTPGGVLAWQYGLAQKLVFSKLQERTGGRMRYFVSGGAPLAPEEGQDGEATTKRRHDVAARAVAAHRHPRATARRDDGRSVKGFHKRRRWRRAQRVPEAHRRTRSSGSCRRASARVNRWISADRWGRTSRSKKTSCSATPSIRRRG